MGIAYHPVASVMVKKNGNCQVPPTSDSRTDSKNLSKDSDSNDAKINSTVKKRFKKWLSTNKRNRSQKRYDETTKHSNGVHSPDHLSNQAMNGDFHTNIVQPSPGKTEGEVRRRLVKGRSSIRRTPSKQHYEITNVQDGVHNAPNYLDLRVISGNFYYGNVKQSVAKFDQIINKNKNGKSVEDLTKDLDYSYPSLSRSMSSRRLSLNDRSSKLYIRRYSQAHASTRIKHLNINQWIPTISGFSIDPYLGSPEIYCISYKVWRHVWYRCDYKCFANNHFVELKYRLIKELNIYRKIHEVKPLYKDLGLYNKAQKHALRLAGLKSITRDRYDKKNGLVMGIAYYPAASIMMKKWYDEGYRYDYSLNYPRPGSQSFTQLIWKSTTHVGIGVANRGYHIWIVLKFYPKGNVNGKYKYNINQPSKTCPNEDSD
uniref:CAP domain-containing protein (inferred by orthology to a zebrafish protein) n=1 Tax=Strongyloides venezuelensis TaxID=75913 RepID=A0A0K0G045_STRVS